MLQLYENQNSHLEKVCWLKIRFPFLQFIVVKQKCQDKLIFTETIYIIFRELCPNSLLSGYLHVCGSEICLISTSFSAASRAMYGKSPLTRNTFLFADSLFKEEFIRLSTDNNMNIAPLRYLRKQ